MDCESSNSTSDHDILHGLIEQSKKFLQDVEDEELAQFYWKYVEEIPVELLHLDYIAQIMQAHGTFKRRRVQRGRSTNLWDSGWGSLLRQAERLEENSYHGRLFRRRFRLPYVVFKELVDELREVNAFALKNSTKISLEFRVLIGLRILGRAWCADDIDEALNIGESTVNYIFKDFIRVVDEFLFEKYVTIMVNQRIAIFNGEVVDVPTAEARTAEGKGGYMVHLTNTLRIDCYETCTQKRCMASFANWPKRLINPLLRRRAEANAQLKVMHFNNYQTWPVLVSKRTIEPHNEILYTYNHSTNDYTIGQPISHSTSSNSN